MPRRQRDDATEISESDLLLECYLAASDQRFAEELGFRGEAIEPAPFLGPHCIERSGYLGPIVPMDDCILIVLKKFGQAGNILRNKLRRASIRRKRRAGRDLTPKEKLRESMDKSYARRVKAKAKQRPPRPPRPLHPASTATPPPRASGK